ncbi:hypothetical protein [Sphingomonas sp. M1-B02]|uniref:hypothetical protein n=1 Tax=Sphingomonas sp. M1-B02 TaxID=3114300 RepID=UPI00223FEC30|nr:hypothetical protein [Sphingomonas sp. S6-11]UZK65211.1 hypothetical protein OKW87_11885 [Sphingomonas sp. S6-11]
MRYFLDTEFNGFGGALIALALVPEEPDAPHFYEALECPDPTPWVAEHVLPVLAVEPIEAAELSRRLEAYLGDDPWPVLIADWPEDIVHAARAMISAPGRRIGLDRVGFELCDAFGYDSSASAVPHNAYHDAVALRAFLLRREAAAR